MWIRLRRALTLAAPNKTSTTNETTQLTAQLQCSWQAAVNGTDTELRQDAARRNRGVATGCRTRQAVRPCPGVEWRGRSCHHPHSCLTCPDQQSISIFLRVLHFMGCDLNDSEKYDTSEYKLFFNRIPTCAF